MKYTARLAVVSAVTFAATALLPTTSVAVGGATAFAAHPSIAAQPEIGRVIDDMAVKNGRLYLGYGNYSANTGPIDIAYVDINTGATGVALSATPTEEISTYRTYGGNLFAPWVDPTGPGSAVSGGMSSDVGGWSNKFTFPAGHVYDYAELGDSRFLVGAIAYGGSGVWESKANGPWQLIRSEVSDTGLTTWERYYWAGVINGKLYVQAKHNGGSPELGHSTMFTMESYDGSRWSAVSGASISGVSANEVETYRERIYYAGGVFDGRSTRRHGGPSFVQDWFNDGAYLYAITSNGTVARTSNGRKWETRGQVVLPSGVNSHSIAVSNGQVYVGTNTGVVYQAAL